MGDYMETNKDLTKRLNGKKEIRNQKNKEIYKFCKEHNIEMHCNKTMFSFVHGRIEYNLFIHKVDLQTNNSNKNYISPKVRIKHYRKFIYVPIDNIIDYYNKLTGGLK